VIGALPRACIRTYAAPADYITETDVLRSKSLLPVRFRNSPIVSSNELSVSSLEVAARGQARLEANQVGAAWICRPRCHVYR